MWDIKDEIWDKQVGYGVNKGEDFAGREIHRNDFQNYNSPYGWNLIEFDHEDYLVVSIKTEREIPKSVIGQEGAEFRVNGKLFNITRNKHNEWDVNTVEFEEEFIPGTSHNQTLNQEYEPSETFSDSYYEQNANSSSFDEEQQQYSSYDESQKQYLNDETQAFSFNNYSSTGQVDLGNNNFTIDNATIQNQQREIEQLQQQLAYEQTQQLEIAKTRRDLSNQNKERMAREQIRQKQEIEQLENQLRFQQQQTQQIEIERNNREIENNNQRLRNLKEQIARTQQYNVEALQSFRAEENTSRTIDALQSMKTGIISPIASYPPINTTSFAYANNSFAPQQAFISPAKTMITDLSRKLQEQTQHLESLKQEHKNNTKKLMEMKNNKVTKVVKQGTGTKDLVLDVQAQRLWEFKFGRSEYGNDFADRVMVKEKFGSLEEGGWDIDYFDKNESLEAFIASTQTIRDRAGRNSFIIDDINYFISKNNGKWEINKSSKGQKFEYSAKNMTNIASNIRPNQEKMFHGEYESYSSLLINLNHFPLIHLNKFELFLKESLSNLPIFKDMFIYSNERLYKNDRSNISAYARVFFKTSSTKNDIEILLATISLKKGMLKFIENFKITNKVDTLSFSMVLMSHQKRLKFVHAQTNFELLRAHPIPLKIPYERLIIDREYNSILKFHENNLWKQLKPFALDWNGNVYYVCDVDPETFDVTFQKQIS